MSEKLFYAVSEREAAKAVADLLSLPMAHDEAEIGSAGTFNPWQLFPCLYGSYDSDFDKCAIEVLTEVMTMRHKRDDLGAKMFREILCTAYLCGYGTSPCACFATKEFEPLLPRLIEKWKEFSKIQWGEEVTTSA